MRLIVIEDHNMILKEVLDVFFCIEIEPIFKSESTKRLKHLLLCEEVDLLRFLCVSFLIKSYKF